MPDLKLKNVLKTGAVLAVIALCAPAYAEEAGDAGSEKSGFLQTILPEGNFSHTRLEFSDKLFAAPDSEKPDIALEYAKYLIGWAMLPEAQSYIDYAIERLDPQDQDAQVRVDVYSAMVSLLDPSSDVVPDGHIDLLREDPLWSVLLDLRSGRIVSADLIENAIRELPHQSEAVIGRISARLFDAARRLGDERLAHSLVEIAGEYGGIEGSSQIMLMRGYLEEMRGNHPAAFDYFSWASEGRDKSAAQARLEMADMALKDPTPSQLVAVRDVLTAHIGTWRGDEVALKIRSRLAQVSEELGDIEAAMITMSQIEQNYPGTPEAELASERIGVILRHLANIITEEKVSLSEAARLVRHVEPYAGLHPERLLVHAAYADRLAENGLESASRAEYALLWSYILPDEMKVIPAELADRIVLERAKSLMARGEALAAMSTVGRRPADHDPALDIEYAKIELFATGKTSFSDVSGVDLQIARHALGAGDHDQALEYYQDASGLTDIDRLNAIRLAAEAGHKDISELSTGLPDDQQGWVEDLAHIRADEPPVLKPLSGAVAESLLTQSAKIIDAAQGITASN